MDSVCKVPVGEDLSFAKKSMVAKRNRYKEKFPCKLLYNILCYNQTYVLYSLYLLHFFIAQKLHSHMYSCLCYACGHPALYIYKGVLLTQLYVQIIQHT